MNKIITISREFGSGGKEIGKRLSDVLGFAFYDRELITEISKETGASSEYINDIVDRGIYPYAFQFAKSFAMYPKMQMGQTEILVKQQKIIKDIAEKGNAIIVGRGADIILKKYNTMDLFVYADMDSKVRRCMEKRNDEGYSVEELESKIKQIDKSRKKYYEFISGLEWGAKENYHLCINTTDINIKDIIPSLSEYINNWFGGAN